MWLSSPFTNLSFYYFHTFTIYVANIELRWKECLFCSEFLDCESFWFGLKDIYLIKKKLQFLSSEFSWERIHELNRNVKSCVNNWTYSAMES